MDIIPNDILKVIFEYGAGQRYTILLKFGQVCKRWRAIVGPMLAEEDLSESMMMYIVIEDRPWLNYRKLFNTFVVDYNYTAHHSLDYAGFVNIRRLICTNYDDKPPFADHRAKRFFGINSFTIARLEYIRIDDAASGWLRIIMANLASFTALSCIEVDENTWQEYGKKVLVKIIESAMATHSNIKYQLGPIGHIKIIIGQ
jgi:hypothetical protein